MTYRIKILKDEEGDLVIPLTEELTAEAGWEVGDELEVKYSKLRVDLINLSMKKMPLSKFKRGLNSLARKLYSSTDPLVRVLVTRNGKQIVLVTKEEAEEELRAIIEDRKNQAEIEVSIDDL